MLPTEEAAIRNAFLNVLKAETQEAYQQALDELPAAFNHPTLASRKQSLVEKQTLFQAWTTDAKLAVVSTPLDQCMKFWDGSLRCDMREIFTGSTGFGPAYSDSRHISNILETS